VTFFDTVSQLQGTRRGLRNQMEGHLVIAVDDSGARYFKRFRKHSAIVVLESLKRTAPHRLKSLVWKASKILLALRAYWRSWVFCLSFNWRRILKLAQPRVYLTDSVRSNLLMQPVTFRNNRAPCRNEAKTSGVIPGFGS
jgi:hypothetical protein